MNTNNNNITVEAEAIQATIRPILDNTLATMMKLSIGDRMPVKGIAEVVGKTINKEPAQILPLVNFFAHNTSLGYVSPGKTGGFQRGVKGSKSVAPITTETNTVETNDTESTETL